MKTFFGVLTLAFAVPAAAQQSAPAADPHAGHAQHQQQAAPATGEHGMMDHAQMMDHERMMEKCKGPHASAEMKACCAEMMKQRAKHHSASEHSRRPSAQHSH